MAIFDINGQSKIQDSVADKKQMEHSEEPLSKFKVCIRHSTIFR